jgi:hypothetical protein
MRRGDFWVPRPLVAPMLRSGRTRPVSIMNRIITSFAAVLVLLLSLATPAFAASCNGASHQPALASGTATPGSAMLGTPITFSVRYSDSADCAPTSITVTVAGFGTVPLSGGGTTYASGVTYAITLTLSPGSHAYSFAATSGSGNGSKSVALTAVSPAAALITVPTPVPTAAPLPPPPPLITPAPRRTAPPAPVVTPAPTAAATATATASPTSSPSPTASPQSASPTASPSPTPVAVIDVHDSWTPAPMGFLTDPRETLSIAATLLAYVGTTGAGLAFFFILLRRRSDPAAERRVATVATAAAGSAGPASSDGVPRVTPLPPMRELIPPVDPDLLRDPDEGAAAGDARVPRWLRPSVQAARRGPMELRNRNWH